MRFSVAYQIPIGALQAAMTSAEFTELCAFANLEPFGERVADHRASMVAATVANAAGCSRKQYAAADFPIIAENRQHAGRAPLLDRWRAFVAHHNEGIKHGRNR